MTCPLHTASSPGFADDFVAMMLGHALDARTGTGTPVFGITGLQGSGKSTLAAQIADASVQRGLRTALLSIDDVYLPRAQRVRLAGDIHPLLETRGPPGTHDVALALDVLGALHAGRDTMLPRFDKLSDERLPAAQWPRIHGPVDLVILEGWFLATPAEDDAALGMPINALERDEDTDGTWRRWCNEALARDYPALWQRIDKLLFLQPPGFDIVPDWRWQQERRLQSASSSSMGMDQAQVGRFVQHFERISRQALRTLPGIADITVALDADRKPVR